ncbi:MAG: CAT RNA binding domain-containing protein [Faecalimonas umbilicata]|uniref:CAT RNA binding domain-containing protein n=1 Tax=Faecalimonas umbilicata TaxID=1912855 RepID=UPI0039A16B3F
MDSYPDERKGERMVYCILRILNNNALLAEEKGDGSERILLGKGIGFGKRAGDEVTIDEGVQVYTPVVRKNSTQQSMQSMRLIRFTLRQRARSLRRQRKYLTRSMEIFYFRWQITLHLPRGGRERIYFFRIRLYRILRFYLEKSMR